MRKAMIIFFFFVSSKTIAQDSSIISFKLNQIRNIPCSQIKKGISGNKISDVAFNSIIAQDTFAIPFLISFLTDTTTSKVKNQIANSYYKKGDLALILINYIEWIPFATLTQLQWCLCCECGNLPSSFLQYFGANRFEFKERYKSYYSSEERRKSIKENSKKSKKKVIVSAQRTTKAFTQYGRTEVKSSFVRYSSLAFGWTSSKPPAFFATLLVRWLSFRSN